MYVHTYKIHKQGEHSYVTQHGYISHNHPYISSGGMLVGQNRFFHYISRDHLTTLIL